VKHCSTDGFQLNILELQVKLFLEKGPLSVHNTFPFGGKILLVFLLGESLA
jgi:hypothetical protein